MQEPAPQNSPKAKLMTRAAVQHAAPFILWIGILLLASMMHLNESSGTEDIQSLNLISDASLYAIRTGLCTLLFLLLRPWRYYPALQKKQILPAIGLGTAIFALWVGFESAAFKIACPQLATFYETWCVMPFGELREPLDATAPYAPAFCGWSLSLIRLLGSAITISIIEEFFWRGYLLRTVMTPDFLDIPIDQFNLKAFVIVAAVFGFEHTEWAAGLITGVAYAIFYLRSRDIWAVSIAHITTNFLLGLYVLATGSWQFW